MINQCHTTHTRAMQLTEKKVEGPLEVFMGIMVVVDMHKREAFAVLIRWFQLGCTFYRNYFLSFD